MPDARERRHTIAETIAWLMFAAWLAGSGFLVWLMLIFPDLRPVASARDTPLTITPGSDAERVARTLAAEEVTAHPWSLALYLRVRGADRQLRSGWVVVNRSLSARALVPRLARGFGAAEVLVPIPEGFTQFDVATRLERYGVARRYAVLAAARDPHLLAELGVPGASVEGYLFPAQYQLALDTPPARVLARMVATFRARTAALFALHVSPENAAPSARLTPHEIVTLASIVEREARVAEERPTIAGVFVNRLLDPEFRPKRLQADPTVAYGCLVAGARVPSCREFDGRRITPAMVRDPENPYSTYRHEGLPPGPICNPGLLALRAAVVPEAHAYLYFVTKGGGRHAFARTLSEHNQNIQASRVPTVPNVPSADGTTSAPP